MTHFDLFELSERTVIVAGGGNRIVKASSRMLAKSTACSFDLPGISEIDSMQATSPLVVLILSMLSLLAGLNAASADERPTLAIHADGRYLTTEEGAPVFLLCDTAWSLTTRVNREDAEIYLNKRREQQFNAVTFVLVPSNSKGLANPVKNHAGHAPFKLIDGVFDPTQPDVMPGPDNDYWDHVDWLISLTRRMGMYAIVLPTWGSAVVGGYDGKHEIDNVLNESTAYRYGHWLGQRFHDQPHVVWMLGGDRRAVYGNDDHRPVFRAMAEGIGDGAHDINHRDGKADFSGLMMSFHSQKSSPQSSDWFHDDAWLSFNSIQHWPEDQIAAISQDWQLTPPKPTWIFEPRYEGYWHKPFQAAQWGEWQMRQQAWQSVFAGGFGFTYGHERIFGFGQDGWDWKQALDAPGANQMGNLVKLFATWSSEDYFTRVPDQSLIGGDVGRAERLSSDRIVATRNAAATLAMIYSADGSQIRVRLDRLTNEKMKASWFNPRTGKWRVKDAEFEQPKSFAKDLRSEPSDGVREFVPPGGKADANDWILVLDAR